MKTYLTEKRFWLCNSESDLRTYNCLLQRAHKFFSKRGKHIKIRTASNFQRTHKIVERFSNKNFCSTNNKSVGIIFWKWIWIPFSYCISNTHFVVAIWVCILYDLCCVYAVLPLSTMNFGCYVCWWRITSISVCVLVLNEYRTNGIYCIRVLMIKYMMYIE